MNLPPARPAAPELYVRHPRARRYVVTVRPDGTVRVTIPRGGSKREAQAFAESQRAWIDRQRQRADQARRDEDTRPSSRPASERIREWRARASSELPSRLLDLAARHGLAVKRVSVRDQRSRWGSCSGGGHICLNWRLVLMPDWVRDYVMIHELMHLKRMDHSSTFWRLVASACPRYQDARRWLRSQPADHGAVHAS